MDAAYKYTPVAHWMSLDYNFWIIKHRAADEQQQKRQICRDGTEISAEL